MEAFQVSKDKYKNVWLLASAGFASRERQRSETILRTLKHVNTVSGITFSFFKVHKAELKHSALQEQSNCSLQIAICGTKQAGLSPSVTCVLLQWQNKLKSTCLLIHLVNSRDQSIWLETLRRGFSNKSLIMTKEN